MTPAVTAAHEFLRHRVAPGGCALDATAGQGHDTVFLARLLGAAGVVHACDLQPSALAATRRRWEALDAPKATLHLHECRHESVSEQLDAAGTPRLHAVMFNLGYLPGSDHRLTTTTASTMAALQSLLPRLAPRGVLTVVAYPRHPGGQEELEAVRDWAAALSPATHEAHHFQPINLGPRRAQLIAIEALGPRSAPLSADRSPATTPQN